MDGGCRPPADRLSGLAKSQVGVLALFATCVLVSATAAVTPLRVHLLVQLLPAIKVFGAFQQTQIVSDKILVNLRDACFLRADREDEGWYVFATKYPKCLQAVQTRNQGLVPRHGDRVQKTNFTNALNER
jgi:hypothetical protein